MGTGVSFNMTMLCYAPSGKRRGRNPKRHVSLRLKEYWCALIEANSLRLPVLIDDRDLTKLSEVRKAAKDYRSGEG